MTHLPFDRTPVTKLPYFSTKWGAEVLCKRDDLFAQAGGGSKARMLQYILADVRPDTTDVVLTAGGPCSNFNRACALMCAQLGVPMHLVEYTDEPEEFETSLNYYMCRLAGIRTTRCDKRKVVETLTEVRQSYESKGLRVKQIYGGGKSLEGFMAYYEAVEELSHQVENLDHVFLACGTGTTLTGILAGMQAYFPEATVHAISTARTWEAEKPVLEEDMRELNAYLGTAYDFHNLHFTDDYLCGGYAKYTEDLMDTVRECLSNEGLIVDPTYSGKAFYGMAKVMNNEEWKMNNAKVLFWNTGGIFNLLATKNDKQ